MTSLFVAISTIVSIAGFSMLAAQAAARLNVAPQKTWSSQYINVGGVAVALAAALDASNVFAAISIGILIAALCICALSDVRYGLVFNSVTYPCAVLLGLCAILDGAAIHALLGGLLCAAVIFALFALSSGRGIGLGDLKLAACIGLGLGVEYGMIALGLAFIVGGAHGLFLLVTRRAKRGHTLKFAPYLALGSCLALAASWISA